MTAAQRKRMDARRESLQEAAREARERDLAAGLHPEQLAERPRYFRVPVWLTPTEHRQLLDAARAAGHADLGEYVRAVMIPTTTESPTDTEDPTP